ncbi:unnamed protein product [Durusdinium trenchii]|uniref:Uncharacterized protein n=1 Tax=Durusdinium trenchii TaxID=1381693 RepID=A0ABP0N2P3_9DINO
MSQALPLSPETRQGRQPGRSASLNRSQWSMGAEDRMETPSAGRCSRRRTEQSITRNRSQFTLHEKEHAEDREGASMRRAASALPLRNSRGDDAARPLRSSTEPFRPPRRSSEASTTASGGGSKGSALADSDKGLGPEQTTASAAKRVAAAFGRPAGTPSPLSQLDDFLQSARRHRREAPTHEAHRGFRPSAEDRAGIASHCWIQEPRRSKWSGPPPPPRAKNRTLQRGTQALPSGPMSLRQEQPSSAEYGKVYTRHDWNTAGVPSPHELNRAIACEGLFGRGTQALPRGPMCWDGTTHHDYGMMYRKIQ